MGPSQQPLKHYLKKKTALAPPIEAKEKYGHNQREQACLKLIWGGGLSTPLTILHRVYIAMCGFLLVILSPDRQEQLARQWLCACIPLFQFPSLLLLNSRFHGGALVRSGKMTMALIFKGVRLVNAFISMYTKESIISALLHSSNKLLHNFHTNLLFYSHYFWFFIFFSQRVFLCALHSPSSWVRDQVGAGEDSVSCTKTLEQTGWSLLWAWSPATVPCNPEHWQLIWISKCLCCMEYFYPALLFLDFLKRQHVINGFHVCIGNYDISGNLKATCNWWWGGVGGWSSKVFTSAKKKENVIT